MAATSASHLLSPLSLGPLSLPNRIVMAPMTRNRAGAGLAPTAVNARYYAQRASAGLIVTEGSQISQQGQGYAGTPGIYSEEQVRGWRGVTDAVHEKGGRIFLQLWHVGRISHRSLQPNGEAPVAPSAIRAAGETFTPEGRVPLSEPRALTLAEIPEIVATFAKAAANAKRAGFDGVEIHGANGYLLDQFLRDGSNKRTDAYGGSVANRARLLLEVTEAVHEVWGDGRVGVRVSPLGAYNDMSDSNPDETFGYVASALRGKGVAYLHVVEPVTEVRDAGRITPKLRQAFGGVVIANGAYTRELAEQALARGEAELVSFGVPFISNPDLPERFRLGAPLAGAERSTFYGGDERGYVDYPALGGVNERHASA